MISFSTANIKDYNPSQSFTSNFKPWTKIMDEVITKQSLRVLKQMNLDNTVTISTQSDSSNSPFSKLHNQILKTKNVKFTNPDRVLDTLFLNQPKGVLECTSSDSLQTFFELTPLENIILQVMIKNWCFSSSLTLQELFGVELYQMIKSLDIMLPKSKIDELLQSFLPNYLSIHLHFDYEKMLDREIIGSCQSIISIDNFKQELLDLKQSITNLINYQLLNEQMMNSQTSNKTIKEKNLQNIDKRFERKDHSIKRFSQTIDLYLKVFSNEKSSDEIIRKQICSYQGQEKNVSPDQKFYQKNIEQLRIFASYYEEMFFFAGKKNYLRHPGCHTPFKSLKDVCINLNNKSSNPTDVITEYKKLTGQYFQEYAKLISNNVIKMELANLGQLTHLSCLKQNRINTKEATLTQNEFIGYMRSCYIEADYIDYFLTKCESIFDSNIVPFIYSKNSTYFDHIQRLILNIACCSNELPKHDLKNPLDSPIPLIAEFENYLCQLITPTQDLCKEIIQNQHIRDLKKRYINKLQSANHAQCIYLLSSLESLQNRFPIIKLELSTLPEKLTTFLKEKIANLPQEFTKKEKEKICEQIHEICVSKSVFILQITMILDDLDAILQSRFSPKDPIIPEMENMMILDLDECFFSKTAIDQEMSLPSDNDEILEKVPVSEELEGFNEETPSTIINNEQLQSDFCSSTSSSSFPSSSPSIPPLPRPAISKPLTKEKVSKHNHNQKIKPTPTLSPEFVKETKTRKIIAMLVKCGFTKTIQGKHFILQDDAGRTIPIPRRDEQCPGTVQSMYKMAIAGLRPKN